MVAACIRTLFNPSDQMSKGQPGNSQYSLSTSERTAAMFENCALCIKFIACFFFFYNSAVGFTSRTLCQQRGSLDTTIWLVKLLTKMT
jgi:hypothetical protein